jgi:hypothetical protein
MVMHIVCILSCDKLNERKHSLGCVAHAVTSNLKTITLQNMQIAKHQNINRFSHFKNSYFNNYIKDKNHY